MMERGEPQPSGEDRNVIELCRTKSAAACSGSSQHLLDFTSQTFNREGLLKEVHI